MASTSGRKRNQEESEETEIPASKTPSTWQYPEDVARMDPANVFKDIRGLPEARYHQDLYRIFTQAALAPALVSKHQKWFELRSHDSDAIDALCASRYPLKSQFKASDSAQIIKTINTLMVMRADEARQSKKLVERLAILHFDYIILMCLDGERNNRTAVYEKAFPKYENDFEKLGQLLQARQPSNSQASVPTDETFSDDTMAMVDRMKVDLAAVRTTAEKGGYTEAKKSLVEAIYLFTDLPHLIELGLHSQGILLHGVTGCGKTSLAMSIAESKRCTVFHMRSSDVVDKWVGATERNVRAVFSIAQASKPSVIFIDEVDALFGARRSDASATEKRLQSELLSAMTKYSQVLVVAATNLPWALDPAFMSRFHQHIHIGLPDESERAEILKMQLKNSLHNLSENDFVTVAKCCHGFTGGAIRQMVSRQFMATIAIISSATCFRQDSIKGRDVFYPCAEGDEGAQIFDLEEIKARVYPPPLTCTGLLKAIHIENRNVQMLREMDAKHTC